MASLSNYLEDAIINHILRGTPYTAPVNVYVGLFTATPSDTGGGTECTGGSYARATVATGVGTWNATGGTDGTTENTSTISFPTPTASWGSVTSFGVYDAPSGGNLLFYANLTVGPKTINTGDTVSFAAGTLSLQIDD